MMALYAAHLAARLQPNIDLRGHGEISVGWSKSLIVVTDLPTVPVHLRI